MKQLATILTIGFTFTTIAMLSACSGRLTRQACTIVQIKNAEVDFDGVDININVPGVTIGSDKVDIGDGGFGVGFGGLGFKAEQVKMRCGRKLLDVSWEQFRTKLNLDPSEYMDNLEGFKQQVKCIRDIRSRKKQVLCKPAGSNDFVALDFSVESKN